MSEPLLRVLGASKSYPAHHDSQARFARLMGLLIGRQAKAVDQIEVLKPLNLEIARGQSMGIVGENGAGKSTLLKLVTGVLKPSSGSIERTGTVGALLELGAGFHPEYSGRENLRMLAALAGLSVRQTKQRMPEIIDFADIGRYIDEPIKHYSSGMVVRLGFAIVAAMRPDLLITDEVLAVGDESFQKKCIAWIEDYLSRGGTVMLVSHGIYHVQKLCQQAIWLHQGAVMAQGDAFSVTQAYLAHHERKTRQQAETALNTASEYRLTDWTINGVAQATHIALNDANRVVDIEAELRAEDDRAPVLCIGFAQGTGLPVYGVASDMERVAPLRTAPCTYRYRLQLDLRDLLPGEFVLRLHPMDSEGLRLFGTQEITVLVAGATRELGAIRLPHRWLVEP